MDNQVKIYCERVKMILHRDYIEFIMSDNDLETLYQNGYTEEAAAQKIFEEKFKFIKPDAKINRLNSKGNRQGVIDVSGMKFFQVAVKADRHYSRMPTELAKVLFHRIIQMLKKK